MKNIKKSAYLILYVSKLCKNVHILNNIGRYFAIFNPISTRVVVFRTPSNFAAFRDPLKVRYIKMIHADFSYMAGTHQEGNPYQTNVTKTFALQDFIHALLIEIECFFLIWSKIAMGKIILNKSKSHYRSERKQPFYK